MFDRELHKFFVYAKFLYKVLRKVDKGNITLDDQILLSTTSLKRELRAASELEKHDGVIPPIKGGI